MALTSQTTVDLANQIQTITFFESSSQVDQITFSSNQITFSAISSYNLSKSDYLLYFKYLNTYFNLLLFNFSSLNFNSAWPLCQFDITESSSGVTHIVYTQNSQGTNVLTITYVPIAIAASISARASPVVISLQEFFMTIQMLSAYTKQVTLN